MKRNILIVFLIFLLSFLVFPQKLTKPFFIGSLVYIGDPSEFLYHNVGEGTIFYLKDNPEGKLIVRICSSDNFTTSIVKAPLNPLRGNYSYLVPDDKIFVANYSKCLDKKKFIANQYWFVPDKTSLEVDEIYPVSDIAYKFYYADDYNYENNKKKNRAEQNKDFAENIAEFIGELKANPKAEGFIVYNSKNNTIKRNIEKVRSALRKGNINFSQVKTVVKVGVDIDKNEKLTAIKDETKHFPDLGIVTLKK